MAHISDTPLKPTTPTKINHAHKFIFVYLFLIVFAGALGGVYTWQHNKVESLSKNVSVLKAEVSKTNSTLTSLQAKAPSTTSETDTLDDGTKITYSLIDDNANVIWWSQDSDDPSTSNIPPDGNIVLSDKRVVQFLSLIPFDILQPLCGSSGGNFDDVSIQLGIYNPVSKTFSHNQYENCITSVANSSTKYASQAKDVSAQASADLNAFEKSLTIVK